LPNIDETDKTLGTSILQTLLAATCTKKQTDETMKMGDLAKASKTLLITYTTCSPHSSLTFFSFSFFWVQHLAYTRQRKENPNPSRSFDSFLPLLLSLSGDSKREHRRRTYGKK
jgi:hypothetical protein